MEVLYCLGGGGLGASRLMSLCRLLARAVLLWEEQSERERKNSCVLVERCALFDQPALCKSTCFVRGPTAVNALVVDEVGLLVQ